MEKFKGTPGPWNVLNKSIPARVDAGNLIIAFVGDENLGWKTGGDHIAYGIALDVEMSNARLIAAAPELLESLQRITLMYEALMRDCGLEHKEMIATSHAAIKKALGEKQ